MKEHTPYNVVCFYWQGERWREEGMEYDHVIKDPSFNRHLRRVGPMSRDLVCKYIDNLYLGVRKWARKDFNFICFTNDDVSVHPGIEIRSFDLVTVRGVLPRMYMFSEKSGLFGSQVLSLDLDVIITGSLGDIMSYSGLFCTRPRFMPGQGHLPDGDIMSFKAGKELEELMWKPLVNQTEDVVRRTQGRERYWVTEQLQDVAELFSTVTPGQILSYKAHVRGRALPSNARIVSCHGHPRPHKLNEKWAKENWKS